MDGKAMGGVDVGMGLDNWLVDRDLVREAGEHAVVEIGKWWSKLSAGFLFVILIGIDLVLGGE